MTWLRTAQLLALGGILLVSGAHAALPASVSEILRSNNVSEDSVAVVVQRVDSLQPLLTHRADVAMNPASTMKLLTTYAGLDLLGPAYRWRTEVYSTGTLRQGKLEGDLILKGYGDPSLMAADVWRLLIQLRQAGIQDIRGDLVLDSSYFAPQSSDAGAFDNEPYRAYNAPPDALVFNLRSTSLRFINDGRQVTVDADPALAQIWLVNQLKPVEGECGDWKSKLSYQVTPGQVMANATSAKPGNSAAATIEASVTSVLLKGSFASTCGEKYLDLSLLGNTAYRYQLFRKLWAELGGSFSGGVRQEQTPPSARLLLRQESLPLADVVRSINKYSNNFMARQLLLTLAAERSGVLPATEAQGAQVINSWLQGKAWTWPELVLENGSGLSRNERISAGHLNALLQDAFASPVMPELMSSLPILAVDGTTQRRLSGSQSQGRVHLKTGSLDGVRAIAGYVLDSQGRRWSVVFIANGARAAYTRSAQDALLEWVYQQP